MSISGLVYNRLILSDQAEVMQDFTQLASKGYSEHSTKDTIKEKLYTAIVVLVLVKLLQLKVVKMEVLFIGTRPADHHFRYTRDFEIFS